MNKSKLAIGGLVIVLALAYTGFNLKIRYDKQNVIKLAEEATEKIHFGGRLVIDGQFEDSFSVERGFTGPYTTHYVMLEKFYEGTGSLVEDLKNADQELRNEGWERTTGSVSRSPMPTTNQLFEEELVRAMKQQASEKQYGFQMTYKNPEYPFQLTLTSDRAVVTSDGFSQSPELVQLQHAAAAAGKYLFGIQVLAYAKD